MIALGWAGVIFIRFGVFLSSDEASLVSSHVYTYRVEDKQRPFRYPGPVLYSRGMGLVLCTPMCPGERIK